MAVERSPQPAARSAAAPLGTDQDLLGEASFDTARSFIDATPPRSQHRPDPVGTSSVLMADSALGASFGASPARRHSSADLLGRHDADAGRRQEAFLSSTPAVQPGAGSAPRRPFTITGEHMFYELVRLHTGASDTSRALKATTSSAAAAHAAIDDLRLQLQSDRDMAARQAEAYSNATQLHHQRLVALFDSVEANSEAIRGLQKSVANTSESVIALEQVFSDAVAKATKTANAALAQASATATLLAEHPVQALGSSVDSRPAHASGSSVDARLPAAVEARAPNLAKVFSESLGRQVPFNGLVMVKGSQLTVNWNATRESLEPFVLAIEMAYKSACKATGVDAIPLSDIGATLLTLLTGDARVFATAWFKSLKTDDPPPMLAHFLADLVSRHSAPERVRGQARQKLERDFAPTECHGRVPQDWLHAAERLFDDAQLTEAERLTFLRTRIKDKPEAWDSLTTYSALREAFIKRHSGAEEHERDIAIATALANAHKAQDAKSTPSSGKTAAASPRSWSSSSPKATPAPSGNNSASETRKAASPAATADHASRSPSQRPPHSKVGRIAAKAKAPGNGSGSRSLETVSSFSDDGTQYSDADEEE